jgi:hypothetical protein
MAVDDSMLATSRLRGGASVVIRIPPGTAWRSWQPARVLEACPSTGRPLTAVLTAGMRAEYMRSELDCFRAALATLAGVPYDQVPDCGSPGDSELARTQVVADLGAWARSHGRRLRWHPAPTVDRREWIGAIPADEWGPSHALVMTRCHPLHDPAAFFPLPAGHVPHFPTLADVAWSVTLDRLEDR